ncbi:MAG: hypothetical protein WCF55_06010, partial [Pseudolabrys sp.]
RKLSSRIVMNSTPSLKHWRAARQLKAKWPQAVQVKQTVPPSRDRSRSGLPESRQELALDNSLLVPRFESVGL